MQYYSHDNNTAPQRDHRPNDSVRGARDVPTKAWIRLLGLKRALTNHWNATIPPSCSHAAWLAFAADQARRRGERSRARWLPSRRWRPKRPDVADAPRLLRAAALPACPASRIRAPECGQDGWQAAASTRLRPAKRRRGNRRPATGRSRRVEARRECASSLPASSPAWCGMRSLARGHDAISCDLLPSESPGPHIQGDVTPLLREPWDLVIAFPPCTFLTQAGIRWITRPGRRASMEAAARFFLDCLNANAPKAAVENPPRMIAGAKQIIGRGADTVVQPHLFGDPWVKTTGLWLRNLDPLLPTKPVAPVGRWVSDGSQNDGKLWKGAPRGHRNPSLRATTFPGIARAMAEQWGDGRRPGHRGGPLAGRLSRGPTADGHHRRGRACGNDTTARA